MPNTVYSIITLSSDAGVVGYPTWGAYGVSKTALDQLTRTWAAELEDTGVRVNCVDPGDINTAMKRATEPDWDTYAQDLYNRYDPVNDLYRIYVYRTRSPDIIAIRPFIFMKCPV
ncbi:MAG: hypothetical protein A2W35_15955 [Chloroflexi bacterium RBG_16_57_11]|nr:MAG: hypothetical protein A2W35_15955 [Chloroflexi bacterium RBG_16_57_11]